MSEHGNVNHKEKIAPLLVLTSAHASQSQMIFMLLVHGIKEITI